MIPAELEQQIAKDKGDGYEPLMIVATTGTTGSGAIDPIQALSQIAARNSCWIHADAAYGGAVVMTEKYKHLLEGVEQADSITFDAHKWLSVPMATSMFLTRHKHILGQTFRIRTDYMPSDDDDIQDLGSFGHSIQWSRRFIGLKLYLPLLVFGWRGYEQTILHQVELGKMLKEKLLQNDWTIDNETDLPVLCFSNEDSAEDPDFTTKVAAKIVESGKAWISTYPIGGRVTIRACITNYSTSENDLDALVEALNDERTKALRGHDTFKY
jgi:glutamate/tyrosine decarboxylase-like PLP-dependent enzyme